MRNFTFIFLLISSGIFSQTIQMPTIPAEGVNYETVTLNAAVSVSAEGPWDFSALNPTSESVISMHPIENSQYSTSEYPNTTHVKYFMSGDQEVVQFPGFTENGYSYNGENSIIINNYSTPLTIMPYPFSVGDSHSDAIYQVEFTCPICPPYMFRDHEITTEALGSGSVTMPDGSVYDNVVLVEHVAIFTDAQTGSSPCITTRTSHFWWAPDLGIPLVETFTQDSTGACSFDSVQFSRFYTGQSDFFYICQPSIECSWGDGFQQFSLAEIDNSSGCEGYGDFTDQVANLDPGVTYDLTVTTGYGDQNLTVWIDFNDDFTFTNDEKVITNYVIAANSGSGTFTETIDFVVPSDAPEGEHLMRAKTNWDAVVPDDACEVTEYGETEDYTVNIGTLGLNNLNSLEMSVYPNPVDGNYVTIQTPINGAKEIEVFDILGKRVLNTNLISDSLDISELNPGVYMVKVTIENQSKVSKLIIK